AAVAGGGWGMGGVGGGAGDPGAAASQQGRVHIDAHEIAARRRPLLVRFHGQVAVDGFHAGTRGQGDVPACLEGCRTGAGQDQVDARGDVDLVGAGRGIVVLQVHVEIAAGRQGQVAVEVDGVVALAAVDRHGGVEAGSDGTDGNEVVAGACVDRQRTGRVTKGDRFGEGRGDGVGAGRAGEGDGLAAGGVDEGSVYGGQVIGDRLEPRVVDDRAVDVDGAGAGAG